MTCSHEWTSVEQRQDDGTWWILEFCAWCGEERA